MVRPNSRLINGISGAQANHAKMQTKNAIHVRWKARMGTVRRLKRSIRVALSAIVFPQNKKASRETQPMTEFRGRRCLKAHHGPLLKSCNETGPSLVHGRSKCKRHAM